LRAKAGISQQDLASRLGVSRQAYGAIETKSRENDLKLFFKENKI